MHSNLKLLSRDVNFINFTNHSLIFQAVSTNIFPKTCSKCTRLVQSFYHSRQIPDFLMALPQKLFCFHIPGVSKPCNPRKAISDEEKWNISVSINTKRIETNKSFLSGNFRWKPGYGEIWEFCHKEWGFHPVSNVSAQRMKHEHFFTLLASSAVIVKIFLWIFLLETGFATKVENC